jgi:hypothetical protein
MLYNTMPQAVAFPPFPSQLQFSSKYIQRLSQASTTTPILLRFGLVEFYNKLPLYLLEMYNLYEYCLVRRVDLRVTFTNTGSTPVTVCLGAYPFNEIDVTITTPEQFETGRYSTWRLAGIATGDSSVNLRRSFDVQQITGLPFTDKSHWIDKTRAQIASTGAVDPHEMSLFVNVANSGVQMWSGYVDVQATYHMEFFSPALPSGPQVQDRVRRYYEGHDGILEAYSDDDDQKSQSVVRLNPCSEEFHPRIRTRPLEVDYRSQVETLKPTKLLMSPSFHKKV